MSKIKNKKPDKHIPPMSKRTRLIIMTSMLTAFLIMGPMILAYSFGYRFDDLGNKLSWVKTGGVYIHSNLSNADIFIDGEFVKSGGLLIRNAFVQNLEAETTHLIEVRKENYHSWIKRLKVKESMVIEGRVLMLPIEIEQREILPYVDLGGRGTTTDDSNTILNLNYREFEILFGLASSTEEKTLANTISNQIDSIFDGEIEGDQTLATTSTSTKDVPEYFLDLGIENPDELENLIVLTDEVAWLEEGNIKMYWIEDDDEKPFYYCAHGEYDNCNEGFELDWDEDILKFNFLPGRNDVWVAMNSQGLWAVEVDDRSSRNIQPLYLGENLDFIISPNNRIVVSDEGIFYELDI